MQNRLKSKVAWLCVVAVIVEALNSLGFIDISNWVNIIGTAIISILVIFGVFNDPTSKDKY